MVPSRARWTMAAGLAAVVAIGGGCAGGGASSATVETPPPDATAAAPAVIGVGDAAPAFRLRGSDGKSYALADYSDRILVVEWFNKDCPTCIRQGDTMKATAAALAAKGGAWLAIDSSHYRKAADNTAFAAEHKLSYPILEDFDGRIGRAYGVKVTPHLFVIRKGRIEYTGAILRVAEERNYVQEAVEALLAGETPPLPSTRAYG
ncbi:MAG: redoxin domain-containing protein [Phycisphaerales bacterium]|nr:redoxin domain-containing protein [Phycisphaerales bacterium]